MQITDCMQIVNNNKPVHYEQINLDSSIMRLEQQSFNKDVNSINRKAIVHDSIRKTQVGYLWISAMQINLDCYVRVCFIVGN